MSCVIYHNVVKKEIERVDKEIVDMMVEICESAEDLRTQTDFNTNRQQQCAGSESKKIRSLRSVLVCLVVLCVLLLTAVIVLCVLIYTNNHQCHINYKNITQERDQPLTNNTKLTEERDQLLTNNTKLTEERDQLTKEIHRIVQVLEQTDRWRYYQSSLYYISSGEKSWTSSRSYCKSSGADLIIINNKEEQVFVTKVTGVYRFWIGLSDSEVEGRWKWVDGSTMTSSFWGSEEPNGQRRENCVESLASGWNDCSCNENRKWICEKNILE